MAKKFTADDAGCYLDGHMGWHNHYRVVDLAKSLGWKPEYYDGASSKATANYRRFITRAIKFYEAHDQDANLKTRHDVYTFDDVVDMFVGQGEWVDQATDYLNTLAPDGYWFVWDMGELSLIPESEMEI